MVLRRGIGHACARDRMERARRTGACRRRSETDRVRITDSGWQAVGMQASASVDVSFERVPALRIGSPRAYVERPGFWHGGAGIAACWFGAAAGIAAFVARDARHRAGPHKLAHLGVIDTTLCATAALLRETAAYIDRSPHADAMAAAMRARLAAETAAALVVAARRPCAGRSSAMPRRALRATHGRSAGFHSTKPRRARRSIARRARHRGGTNFMASVTTQSADRRTGRRPHDIRRRHARSRMARMGASQRAARGRSGANWCRSAHGLSSLRHTPTTKCSAPAGCSPVSRKSAGTSSSSLSPTAPRVTRIPPNGRRSASRACARRKRGRRLQRLHLRQVQVVRLGLADGAPGSHRRQFCQDAYPNFFNPAISFSRLGAMMVTPTTKRPGAPFIPRHKRSICPAWRCRSGPGTGRRRTIRACHGAVLAASSSTTQRMPGSFGPCRLFGANSIPIPRPARRQCCPSMCWHG